MACKSTTKDGARRGSAWQPLIFNDQTVQGGHYANLPTTAFLPDLGISVTRDSWQDKAVAAMFKCGPMGGYKAGAWRLSRKDADGKLPYENVAHDHPDANSFVVLGDGEYLAETDRYAERPGKLSSSVNTILINGIGQAADGQPEGQEWQQPGDHDMTEMAKITAYKDAGDVVVAEGEAAGSYLAYEDAAARGAARPLTVSAGLSSGSRTANSDVRRHPLAEAGRDHLAHPGRQAPAGERGRGRYRLAKGAAAVRVPACGGRAAQVEDRRLDRQRSQQTDELAAPRPAPRETPRAYACVIDPWHKEVKVTLTPDGPDKATITVSGQGIADTWKWEAAKGRFEAATWHGSRQGGFDVTVDAQTAAPPAP